ncbi:MAG: hypothetical protein HZC36_01325 [Armatimonadetes bacterium]|nr:hypothetical protein [Armatimonadota bacterium]
MSLTPFERGDSKSGIVQAVPWHTQMFSRDYQRADDPELAIEGACRAERNNLAAARIGLPTVGQVLENQHGIRFQVKEHLYLPNVNTAQRWRIGEKGLPDDLYPVIEPLNLSARLMDFIGKVDRCTTKVFIPVDTMPGFRKDAVPRHNALHTSDAEALLIFLDAATLHETILAHEVGHAWVQYVDQCEDERTLADVSDPARLNQLNFIQSYVLDLKVNELLRRKGFDMDPIDGDDAIAMNNIAKLLDSGFSPPTKREAVFGALQFAEQIVERERGNRPGLMRFDDAVSKLERHEPEIHRLAFGMAEAVFEHGIESKKAIGEAIDRCLRLAFEFSGDPLDFEKDLVVPPDEEPNFDKWPDWIPGAIPRVKCQIGRVMALNDITDESTWTLACNPISGASVSFELSDGAVLGPWSISTPYNVWHRNQMKELDNMNKRASIRNGGDRERVMQLNKENQERMKAAYAIPTFPSWPGQSGQPQPPGGPQMPNPGGPFPASIPGRRPYMAGLGRFLTEARLAERLGGEHPYGYALDNPTTYTDPNGLQPKGHGKPRFGAGLRECKKKKTKEECFKCAYDWYQGNMAFQPKKACDNANLWCGTRKKCGPLGIEPKPSGGGCFSILSYAEDLHQFSDKIAHCWAVCMTERCWGVGCLHGIRYPFESDPLDKAAEEYGLYCAGEDSDKLMQPSCLSCCASKTYNLPNEP